MRVDSTSNVYLQGAPQGSASGAPKLAQGDIIVAEVVQAKGDQVTLKLESGEVVKALMLEGVPLSKGDVATMLVTQSGETQLTMQVLGLSDKRQANLTPEARMLVRMGFEVNKENLQLISMFNQLKLPIKPELFERAIALSQQQPQLDKALTVFFAANAIDVNEQVLASMKALLSGSLTGEALTRLAGDVDATLAVLRSHVDALGAQGETPSALSALLSEAEQAALAQSKASATPQQAVQQATQPLPQGHAARMEQALHDVVSTLVAADPKAAEAVGGEERITQTFARMLNAPQLREAVTKEGIQTLLDKFTYLDAETRASVTAKLEALIAPYSRLVQAGVNGARYPDEGTARGALTAVLNKIQDVFIQLDGKGDGKALKTEAEALPQKLTAMQQEMQQSVSGKSALARQAAEVVQQNRLHNDISSCAYMQIPIQIRNRQQTAELFVLKRNGPNTRIDPEHATIVVALETERMGRVETVIKVEGKGVGLQFRMNDERALGMFRDETADMYHRMQEAGYRLTDMRCTSLDTPVTPLNFAAMMAEEMPKPFHRVDVTA